MNKHRHTVRTGILLLLAVGLGCGLASCGGSGSAAAPEPPDFSGWWAWQYTSDYQARGPDGKPGGLPQMLMKAQMKPEIMTFLTTVLPQIETATKDRKELFGANTACLPPYFFGVSGGPYYQFEFLFTPGRVTVADEMNLVRRISLDQALPAQVHESNAGTSVGHWEGDTLVVETTGIDHTRSFLIGRFPIGKGVHVLERFRLKEPDLLEVSVELTAPAVLTAPFKDTFFYKRDRNHVYEDQSSCTEVDRSIDHAALKEQFDLTPPEDLPPPPSD